MPKKTLPLAAMEKLLKKGGAERISETSKSALKEILEDKAEEIAKLSITLSSHAGRKTIKAKDIKLASK